MDHGQSVPMVTVTAPSGMAAVFDARTGRILDLDIRNRYCVICRRAERKEEEPNPHFCHRNWYQRATSMESDIIVKFFEESEKKYNLRYKFVIGKPKLFHIIITCEV